MIRLAHDGSSVEPSRPSSGYLTLAEAFRRVRFELARPRLVEQLEELVREVREVRRRLGRCPYCGHER